MMRLQQVKFNGKWMPIREAEERSGVSHCVIRRKVKEMGANVEWDKVFYNDDGIRTKGQLFPQDLYERMIGIMDEALINRKGLRIV